MEQITDWMYVLYPYAKSLHIMAVLAWMAALFYLPRLFVYHVEEAEKIDGAVPIFLTMEYKLMRYIMRPAMHTAWTAGLFIVLTPGFIDWTMIWPWTKGAAVLGMTAFHTWLVFRVKGFQKGENSLTGRQYRMMNEVPTLLMVIIVVSVIFKF